MQKEFKKEGIKKVYLNCTLLILWFVYSGYWIIYFGISLLFIPTFATKTKSKKAKTKRSEMRTKRIRKKSVNEQSNEFQCRVLGHKTFYDTNSKTPGGLGQADG